MKKVVFILLLFLGSSMSLLCQKRVGDIVMDYEFPAVVVYVDETGEHGLLLGLHNYPTAYSSSLGNAGGIIGLIDVSIRKQYVRERGMCGLLSNFYPQTMSLELQEKYYSEQYPSDGVMKRDENGDIKRCKDGRINIESIKGFDKEIAFAAYSAVEACELKSGQDIASFIDEYCKSHSIDKSIYFRSQFWADCLGEGWFIPGDEELELMCPALCGYRLGEEYEKSKSKENTVERYMLSLFVKIRQQIGNLGYYSPMILSSNMSVHKKVGEYHTLCVAGLKQFKSKIYKPIISSGFVDIDKKLYGKFGEWKCETNTGIFGEMCYSYGFHIPTLPVKKF